MNLGPYGPLSFMLSGFSQLFCTGMCLWLGDPKNSSVDGFQTRRPFGLGLERTSKEFLSSNFTNFKISNLEPNLKPNIDLTT